MHIYAFRKCRNKTKKKHIEQLNSEIAALKNRNEELEYKLSSLQNTNDTENVEIIDSETPSNINMSLQTLIKENSWFYCDKCEYKTKSRKGLKKHTIKSHDKVSNIEETLKCNICEKEAISIRKLKVHNAKWHTKVYPEPGYGYMTNMLPKFD